MTRFPVSPRSRHVSHALLHDDVAAALTNFREPFLRQNLADFAAREDAELTVAIRPAQTS